MSLKSKKGQKNRDHVNLLISDQKFQEEIRKIRVKLGIPSEGFTKNAEIEAWTYKAADEADEIFDSEDFCENLLKIDKDFQDQKITSREKDNLRYEAHLVLPTNYEAHAIREIIKNFNLPENYEFMLRTYLVNNSTNFLPNNFSISYSKDQRSVSVNIYTRLTDEDLREIKEFVNTYHGDKLPYIQSLNNLSEKLSIEELDRKAYEVDAVTYKPYRLTNKDIAERVLGDPSRGNEVYEAKRGLERLRKSRFTTRKTIDQ
ncbi:MAG: hypothetical protein WAV46_04155 [Candidatus Moraniibacteriota bacterium]